jgi:hypothetical protein
MVILITVTDAKISPASESFTDMLEASFAIRRADTRTLIPEINPQIHNASTSDAANSKFATDLYQASKSAIAHMDIRSYNGSETPEDLASKDFLIANTAEISTSSLAEQTVNALNDYTEVMTINVDASSMYPSAYASLIVKIPTLTILVNEDSMDLYRAAADSVAEVVGNYLQA